MKSIQKLVAATGTSYLDNLIQPAAFVVSISQSMIKKLLSLCEIDVFDSGDQFMINLGHIKPLDEEGEVIELDWRPTFAQIDVYGKFGRSDLRRMRLSVGSMDVVGEYMYGTLELTEDELVYLMDDGSDEEGTFSVYAVTSITRQAQVVQGTRNQILARCNDASDLQGTLLYAEEMGLDTTFHVEPVLASDAESITTGGRQ